MHTQIMWSSLVALLTSLIVLPILGLLFYPTAAVVTLLNVFALIVAQPGAIGFTAQQLAFGFLELLLFVIGIFGVYWAFPRTSRGGK